MDVDKPKRLFPFLFLCLIIIFTIATTNCSIFQRATDTPTITVTITSSPTFTSESSPTLIPSNTLLPSPSPSLSPTPAYKVTVTALLLNARSGPAVTYTILAELPKDTVLTVLAHSSDSEWFYIILPENDGAAWVWIGGVSYDFDINLLPILDENHTPTPTITQTTSYGAALLAPPNLPGIAPSASGNPARHILSIVSVSFLIGFMLYSRIALAINQRKLHKSTLSRLMQMITSLF